MWLIGAVYYLTHSVVLAGQQCSGRMTTGYFLYCGGSSSCCGNETQRYCCEEPEGLSGGTIVAIVGITVSGSLVAMWLLLHYMKLCCCQRRGPPVPRIIVTQPSVPGEPRDGPSLSPIPPTHHSPTAPFFEHDPPPHYQPSPTDKPLGGLVKPIYGHTEGL
ncbi:hypothetical protein HDE_12847 [Halotydeus destructor]|nr:hypothetical protein HDE_12847 [Halotydeus destructor]